MSATNTTTGKITQIKPGLILPGREVIDPGAERQKIVDAIGDVSDVVIMGNRILVAKFIREKDGSIIVSEQTQKEDEFQGKVGLVLGVGPLAYKEDTEGEWGGQTVKVGDWVMYRASSGIDFDLRPVGSPTRVKCKWLFEGQVDAVIPRPDFAY